VFQTAHPIALAHIVQGFIHHWQTLTSSPSFVYSCCSPSGFVSAMVLCTGKWNCISR